MGFFLSKAWDPATQIPDLSGKVAIVTGGNAGIGYATTAQLARHGAKVYLAARSEKKAQEAIENLYREIPNLEAGKVVWLPLDLSSLDSVAKAAETVCKNETRLDILVNNAGLATKSFETTPQGFEMTIGVNHLGHFLFTLNLLPLLKSTASTKDSDVRVVMVSSSAHSMLIPATLDFKSPTTAFHYAGPTSSPTHNSTRDLFSRYGISKLANILMAKELQRQLDTDNIPIIVTSVNPGPVATEGGMGVFPGFLRPVLSMTGLWVPPSKGAIPIIYLAAEPEIRRRAEEFKARYFSPKCKAEEPSKMAQDSRLARNLWVSSMTAVAEWVKA